MKRSSTQNIAGFSLVEICICIGIVAFAFVGIMGLLPAGMDTFRQSMNTSIGSQIIQRVVTEVQQTDFELLIGGPLPRAGYYEFTTVRYFDEQGNEFLPKVDKDGNSIVSEEEKKKSVYHVHVVAQSTPLFPDDKSGNTIEMNDLANVTVQVAVNPGQQVLTVDQTTKLWNPLPNVPIRSQSVIVANHD